LLLFLEKEEMAQQLVVFLGPAPDPVAPLRGDLAILPTSAGEKTTVLASLYIFYGDKTNAFCFFF
jgi:hypothetical protein